MKRTVFLSITLIYAALLALISCKTLPETPANTEKMETKLTAEKILSSMTLEEKVAQLFIIRPDALDLTLEPEAANENYKVGHKRLTSNMKETLHNYPVGGFIIFGKNIKNKSQLKKLISELKEESNILPIISVDEEGGRVARLAKTRALDIENVSSMEQIGQSRDTNKALEAGYKIGSYLNEYGFNSDFAPIADINTNPQNIVIGDRAFGSDPYLVSQMDNAFLQGLHKAGIIGCLKHFPGHGDTKDDTHSDFVAVEKTWEELKTCELIPFINNFDTTDMIMLAHLTLTKATSDSLPGSLSYELITKKLRKELGYNGIVLTDALNMGAIKKHYDTGEASIMAFLAGNDFLLMPQDFVTSYNAVLEAVKTNRIPMERLDQSVIRILNLKSML